MKKATAVTMGFFAVSACMTTLCACNSSQKQADAAVKADTAAAAAAMKNDAKAGDPAALEVVTVKTTAVVQSIDRANRTVTLKNEGGAVTTYKCRPEVRNFDQIQVGDHVKAQLVESLAVFVAKPAAAGGPSAGLASATALAPKGAKPGIVMADTTEVTAKIVAVDAAGHSVAVTGPLGNTRTFSVNPAVDLSGVQVGDDVVVRYTQGLAIVVEKAD
jgi:hypothetical protein